MVSQRLLFDKEQVCNCYFLENVNGVKEKCEPISAISLTLASIWAVEISMMIFSSRSADVSRSSSALYVLCVVSRDQSETRQRHEAFLCVVYIHARTLRSSHNFARAKFFLSNYGINRVDLWLNRRGIT